MLSVNVQEIVYISGIFFQFGYNGGKHAVFKKGKPRLQNRIENIVKCANPKCISREEHREKAPTIFYTMSSKEPIIRCHYCDDIVIGKEITLL